MAPKLKVWGTHNCFVPRHHPASGQNSGQVHAVIAATSQKAAAEALGMSVYEFRNYTATTDNELDVAAALAHPGKPVVTKMDHGNGRYWLKDGTEVTT